MHTLRLVRYSVRMIVSEGLGGGNSNIFYFHPELWGRFPFWRAYFSDGLKPPTRQWFTYDFGWKSYSPWNQQLAPENGWLEYFLVSFWDAHFSGAFAVSFREFFTTYITTSFGFEIYQVQQKKLRVQWSAIVGFRQLVQAVEVGDIRTFHGVDT